MYKVEFQNAVARDGGYGLEVNGKSLSEIISTLLGTRVGNNYGICSGLPEFKSNCCNVTVIIDPQPVITQIEDEHYEYESVADLEEDRRESYEQFRAEDEKTDPKG